MKRGESGAKRLVIERLYRVADLSDLVDPTCCVNGDGVPTQPGWLCGPVAAVAFMRLLGIQGVRIETVTKRMFGLAQRCLLDLFSKHVRDNLNKSLQENYKLSLAASSLQIMAELEHVGLDVVHFRTSEADPFTPKHLVCESASQAITLLSRPPIIAFLEFEEDPAQPNQIHAVVVLEATADQVHFKDPAFSATQTLSLQAFLDRWELADFESIGLRR